MFDTSKSMQLRFDQMIMSRTPMERLRMGSSMFDTARKIVRSSILNQNPQSSVYDLKKQTFLRFYGEEFSEIQKKNILDNLSQLSK